MNSPKHLQRALAQSWTRYVLLTAYVLVLFAILAPVLLSSVGADDSYWILEKGEAAGGSYWKAFWEPLSHAFDFSGGQARTTALSFAERGVLATFTLQVSTYFSIPPFLVWAAVKIVLLLATIGATVLFLRQLTFRHRDGDVRHLSPASIAFIATTLPLTIALGAKSQNVGTLNGWNFYPTLTYGSFVVLLLVGAMSLRATSLLDRHYRLWAAPVLIVMALLGVIINLSYELMAVAVPLTILIVLLRPRPRDTSWWKRWRPDVTVIGGLVLSYSGLFLWIRWRISQMDCQATDSCYAGTVVKLEPGTLRNNFLGSLPGGNGAFVGEQADLANRSYPGVSAVSIGLALLGVALMLTLWAAWSARRNVRLAQEPTSVPGPANDDARGLLMVLIVSVAIAIGATGITGITARANEMLDTSMLSYRTNIVTWTALSLAAVTIVRLLMISGRRLVGPVALGGLSLVLVVGVALYFPRNVFSAQVNRAGGSVSFIDALQREVTTGDRSDEGDARRCGMLETFLDDRDEVSPRISRAVIGAQKSFQFLHQVPYCSEGLPAVVDRDSN